MTAWFLVIGAVLVLMAFTVQHVERLPLSPAILYLAAGVALGPLGAGLLPVDPVAHAGLIEVLAEVAVLVTLFVVGLRLPVSLTAPAWRAPLRLATVAMVLTMLGAALAAHWLLALPLAAAVLLGAILAPTDPVLAADVQVRSPADRDALRFALTAEGGLNDGAAFPGVMLGLGLLGLGALGPWGLRWVGVDLVWAIGAGLAIGWCGGQATASLVTLTRRHGRSLESEEFLVLGVIALIYGAALAVAGYGFLAVFAAGLALAQRERTAAQARDPAEAEPARLSERLRTFGGQCERLLEVALVLLIGAALAWVHWSWPLAAFIAVLLLVVRPLAVRAVLRRRHLERVPRRLVMWFGIRGVGSVYYLSFALARGVPPDQAALLASATLATIAVSIVLHGVSATPLMARLAAPGD